MTLPRKKPHPCDMVQIIRLCINDLVEDLSPIARWMKRIQ
jgi:hypothetical protein